MHHSYIVSKPKHFAKIPSLDAMDRTLLLRTDHLCYTMLWHGYYVTSFPTMYITKMEEYFASAPFTTLKLAQSVDEYQLFIKNLIEESKRKCLAT